jgi:chlorite dismutase
MRGHGSLTVNFMSTPLLVTFAAGSSGAWRIIRNEKFIGEGLPKAERLEMLEGPHPQIASTATWVFRGSTSNLRYTNHLEAQALAAKQQGLGRPQATLAAFIPMRKSAAWWALAQDERRAILEEKSRHIAIGMEYLPGIARRLHHSREFGEPFDFLAWLEYAPDHSAAFEELLRRLRATEEWKYVEREVDIRLMRD